MPYSIIVNAAVAAKVRNRLEAFLERSRFTVRCIDYKARGGNQTAIELREIRLREKKDYCGQHAGPCLLNERRHREYHYLEGLDWVAFNDMVNDLLDQMNLEADVTSSACRVRRGGARRINYGMHDVRVGVWDKNGDTDDYLDCRRKKATPTTSASGTPGIEDWRRKRPRRARVARFQLVD